LIRWAYRKGIGSPQPITTQTERGLRSDHIKTGGRFNTRDRQANQQTKKFVSKARMGGPPDGSCGGDVELNVTIVGLKNRHHGGVGS